MMRRGSGPVREPNALALSGSTSKPHAGRAPRRMVLHPEGCRKFKPRMKIITARAVLKAPNEKSRAGRANTALKLAGPKLPP